MHLLSLLTGTVAVFAAGFPLLIVFGSGGGWPVVPIATVIALHAGASLAFTRSRSDSDSLLQWSPSERSGESREHFRGGPVILPTGSDSLWRPSRCSYMWASRPC